MTIVFVNEPMVLPGFAIFLKHHRILAALVLILVRVAVSPHIQQTSSVLLAGQQPGPNYETATSSGSVVH